MMTNPSDAAGGTRLDPPTEPYLAAQTADRTIDPVELALLGIALLLMPALTLLREYWPARLTALVVLLVVPGVLLLRVLRVTGRSLVVLLVPSSLAVLLFTGLAVTLLGPVIGIDRPLRPLPQLVGIELVALVLLGVLAYRNRDAGEWTLQPLLSRLPSPAIAVPLLLPVVAIAGAQRLNSGHDGALAVIAVVLGVLTLAAVVVRAPKLGDGMVAVTLYAVGLSSLYSFSLRTEVVYGYDIATEYRKMVDASTTGVWQLAHVNDPYGAMLSITVLPAQLQQVTGISLQVLVQFVYPGLFALVPLIVFFMARRFLDRRWALVGATVMILQANFGQQMPGLARQEIGFLLFAAALFVLVAKYKMDGRAFALLVLLFAGVVVSHYSTAYLTILIFFVALLIVAVAASRRPVLRRRAGALFVALIVLIGGVTLWNGALTRSTSNLGNVVSGLTSDGLLILPNRGESSLLTYISGTVTPQLPAAEYQQVVEETYAKDRRYVVPFPDGTDPVNAIQDVASAPDSAIVDAAAVVSFVLRQIIYLAALIGALAVLLLRSPAGGSRDSVWLVGGLGFATVIVLVLIRISGTLATSYNQDRALLHALIVMSVGVGWCGQALAEAGWLRRRSNEKPRRILASVVAVLIVVQLTISLSLSSLPAGGGNTNLSNDGEDSQRFFAHRSEQLAGEWLVRNAGQTGLVYADRYGSLRILLATGRSIGVLPEMVPAVIDRNAWIYVSTTNLEYGNARSETDGNFGTYKFPAPFLSGHFNIIYSNGSSQILHR